MVSWLTCTVVLLAAPPSMQHQSLQLQLIMRTEVAEVLVFSYELQTNGAEQGHKGQYSLHTYVAR